MRFLAAALEKDAAFVREFHYSPILEVLLQPCNELHHALLLPVS